jgi:hypothetical protein
VLLVDDDDNRPDVRAYYTNSLDTLGYDYDLWDTLNSDDEPDIDNLAPYDVVIWFLGDEWEAQAGPGDEAEIALASWLDSGKCLILSGQDYLWNRGITDFVGQYLGVEAFDNDVSQASLTGVGEVFKGLGPYPLAYPFYNFSDALTPTDSALAAFVGDHGTAGLIVSNENFRTAFWAFPFAAVDTVEARNELMGATLSWCEGDGYEFYLPLIHGEGE